MSAQEWLVFVGQWDDRNAVTLFKSRCSGYNQARAVLSDLLAPFLSDTCRDCQISGTLAMQRLARLPAGTEFVDEVDGSDYALIRPDREELADLYPAYDATRCERCAHPIRFHLFGACITVGCDCPDPHRV